MLRARNRFFWPKMAIDINDFVNSCVKCVEHKRGPHHNKAPPKLLKSMSHLFSRQWIAWAPCQKQPGGIITQDQRASTVTALLVSRVFSRFGPPTMAHSYQGRNFESNLKHEICALMGILKSHTTAYHPQYEGQVERQNQTLQNILSSFVSQHRDDLDNWVSLVVYAYNTSCHASTGLNPYELVFGRDTRTPIEFDLGLPWNNPCSESEYTQSLRHALSSIITTAQVQLDHSRSSPIASRSHSLRKSCSPYIPGTYVWLRHPKSWKFRSQWVGLMRYFPNGCH